MHRSWLFCGFLFAWFIWPGCGSKQVCTPGTRRCDSLVGGAVCNQDGTRWTSFRCYDKERCIRGVCTNPPPPPPLPTDIPASSESPSDGARSETFVPVDAGHNESLTRPERHSPSERVKPPEPSPPACQEGATRCEDAKTQAICTVGQWRRQPCPQGQICKAGKCGPHVCHSGNFAYLHGDLWIFWYNHRIKCDPQHRNYWRCEKKKALTGRGDCSKEQAAYLGCDPRNPQYGEYGAPKHDTRTYNYDALYNTLYGAAWGPRKYNAHATLKIQDASIPFNTFGKEMIAYSSNPGEPCAYMKGTKNHGFGGCMMSGDRFGAFAWIKVPANKKLLVGGTWLPMGPHFPGCSEYIAGTCTKGFQCYQFQTITFQPGKHYYWSFDGIKPLPNCGPPAEIIQRFAAIGKDVSDASKCP